MTVRTLDPTRKKGPKKLDMTDVTGSEDTAIRRARLQSLIAAIDSSEDSK